MTNQSGVHYLHEHSAALKNKGLPREVQKVRDTVTTGLSDLLQGALDAVDDSLFELANHARSNNEQNRYFEAMREVRIKRKGVEDSFRDGLLSLFHNPPSLKSEPAEAAQENISAESLSLIQNDDLEEQVAINAMVTKAKAYFQGTLLQLQTRFSAAYGTNPEEMPLNPLSPEHLCNVFLRAMDELDVQIRERLIVLKQFDRYVVSNLGMILDEANRILVQAGVMPNFKYKARTEPSKARAAEGASGETSEPEQGPLASDEAAFNQIRQLLANYRQQTGYSLAAQAHAPNVHVIAGAELIDLLRRLPQPPITGDLTQGEPVQVNLHEVVAQLLAEQKGSEGRETAINEVDEDLINLVSMLFEFILDDYNLSPPIQVLISRLQIPILKVVIKDRAFFSKATHPARKLLNSLARAGIGWSDSNEKNRDRLYEQIHNVVQRILNEFDGDISLFERLYEEFDQFLSRENRKATLVEQRTRESERGRIKSQKAQEMVDRVLQEKLRTHSIPESIRNILQNGWSRVMFLAYLRDDTEHRWAQSVRVVDDLLWCLRPHNQDDDRELWVRLVPTLLKTIRAGLEEVSYNAARLDEMMSDLKRELTQAFRRQAAQEAAEDSEIEPPKEPADQTAVEKQKELEDAAMAEHLSEVDNIGVGAWVEFNLVNGARFRCKLSAIIDEADTYVFVNRMGLKVVEKKRVDLAHELRRGRLTLLEQGALIDRALDAVVGRLKRTA
ncbi:DUF1631 domain-containing protein [Marinobacteraceae bacterium S3BR75-40.1]